MPPAITSNQALYIWNRDFLQRLYADKNIEPIYPKTLAMLITGMLLGPHVQLFAIAMCVPLPIKLPSLVRRFERFVADEQVEYEGQSVNHTFGIVRSSPLIKTYAITLSSKVKLWQLWTQIDKRRSTVGGRRSLTSPHPPSRWCLW